MVDESTADWRYEVANGDTILGFTEWLAHKVEANKALDTDAEFTIPAECHSDDHLVEIEFNARAWFEVASDDAIVQLAFDGWDGGCMADDVAVHFDTTTTKKLFDYLSLIRESRAKKDCCGFECSINESAARKWIKLNKPEAYGLIVADHGE